VLHIYIYIYIYICDISSLRVKNAVQSVCVLSKANYNIVKLILFIRSTE